MTEIPFRKDITGQPVQAQGLRRLTGSLRAVAGFALVLGVIIFIWQLVKAQFSLSSLILPNVGEIANALVTPLQEGKQTLGELLIGAGLFTFREAALGFALGASIGFVLAVIFAHSRPLERGLMPFVVASQTVPILAIAP